MVSDQPSGARAAARCRELTRPPYSDRPDRLFRGWLTPAYRATIERVGGWMAAAGMTVRCDAAINLIGRYEGASPDAPALVIGSHLDSVADAGAYDGPLGVMLGIECVAALHAQRRRLPFAIEVIGFGDEEGSRFPAAMLGSRAVAGTLTPGAADMADADGVSVDAALREFGSTAAALGSARRAPGSMVAYLEAHIEQGPVLEAEGLALGTVTGIAAQLRLEVTVRGHAGHAGTVTMPLRRDALAAAARMVAAIEDIALADASDLVATVGRIAATPGAANVIAGEARFTVDIRAGASDRRDRAATAIDAAMHAIARERGVAIAVTTIHDLPPAPCDARLMDLMDAAIVATGQPARRLLSGAGHDAMAMAALGPVAMLFLRCAGGISHHPAEHVDSADADAAFAAMRGFIDRLGEDYRDA
ncbi:allantoate amidohydrolase [Sphingomonas sp. VNH70]|uniref:allantoate amidohydrolase n=1 Tax=Sphingomonas silueang TaxID=3156617 RepID=UPI0032B4062B